MKKSSKEMEQAAKENEESKRRTVFMVVSSSTLSFITRAPLMLTSVNDLRVLINKPFFQFALYLYSFSIDEFETSFSFNYNCSNLRSCQVFQAFGNCLYLFSLSTVLFFLKHFDKNFRKAYQVCFPRQKGNSLNDNKNIRD